MVASHTSLQATFCNRGRLLDSIGRPPGTVSRRALHLATATRTVKLQMMGGPSEIRKSSISWFQTAPITVCNFIWFEIGKIDSVCNIWNRGDGLKGGYSENVSPGLAEGSDENSSTARKYLHWSGTETRTHCFLLRKSRFLSWQVYVEMLRTEWKGYNGIF